MTSLEVDKVHARLVFQEAERTAHRVFRTLGTTLSSDDGMVRVVAEVSRSKIDVRWIGIFYRYGWTSSGLGPLFSDRTIWIPFDCVCLIDRFSSATAAAQLDDQMTPPSTFTPAHVQHAVMAQYIGALVSHGAIPEGATNIHNSSTQSWVVTSVLEARAVEAGRNDYKLQPRPSSVRRGGNSPMDSGWASWDVVKF